MSISIFWRDYWVLLGSSGNFWEYQQLTQMAFAFANPVSMNMCVEVKTPATPATRLNINSLTRNITRNTGATTRNIPIRPLRVSTPVPNRNYFLQSSPQKTS
jgi:hypothetical protein